jgi:hypothetical protein
MKKTVLSLSMLMLAVFLLVAPACADTLNLSLASPIQTGTPNGTLTFNATVSAPSANSATIFLNGDNFNVSLAGATIDDTDFLLNFPLSLDPSNSFTGDLFTVSLPSVLIPGTYNGFFEILGGADPAAQSVLAIVNFQVNAPAPVPEPGTWLLLATGLPLLAMWGYKQSSARSMRTLCLGGKVGFNSGNQLLHSALSAHRHLFKRNPWDWS